MSHTTVVVLAGLLIGLVFGLVAQRSGFCLMSGVRGWLQRDGLKLRAFALAAAVAIAGTQALAAMELISLEQSLYLQPTFSWLLVPLGGLLFGYGMAMANGCGARALVLLGTGNLRSFVVLVCLAIGAYATLSGLLAPLRVWLVGLTSLPGYHFGIGNGGGALHWLPALAAASLLALFAVLDKRLRASPRDWLGGLIIGALVPAGWFATGYLGADDFEPVRLASLTFVAPIGDTLQYVMLSTGTALDFGVTIVTGVVLGSLLGAATSGGLQLQGFASPRRMLRYMAGGNLMGIGGALALGCSIGQGLTGVSTLALASFIAIVAIIAGAMLGLRGPLRLPAL